ncbi:MAG: BrnT family toxin [Thermomicrobiales bacterium]
MVWFRDLIFDDWNKEHIARHGVEWDEATEAVRNAAFMTRGRGGTYQLVGQTDPGRFLAIVLAPRGQDVYYVVTAREATRDERRRYRRR